MNQKSRHLIIKAFSILSITAICINAEAQDKKENKPKFSIEKLEGHRQSYRELGELAGNSIPLADAFFSGSNSRSANTMANGIAYLVDLEYLLEDISHSLDPNTLRIVRGRIAGQYVRSLNTLKTRHATAKGMQKFANSQKTVQYLKTEMEIDERCHDFMLARARSLLGGGAGEAEKTSKLVMDEITSILEKKSDKIAESEKFIVESTKFGQKMNQKSAKLSTENVLSSEMGDAPFLVGYVPQDYNSIYRNGPFLVTHECVALILGEHAPEETAHAALETLLIAHLKYYIKTNTRIEAVKEFQKIYGQNRDLVNRLNDLQKDLKTAGSFSKQRVQELLESNGFREKLRDVTKEVLSENGF